VLAWVTVVAAVIPGAGDPDRHVSLRPKMAAKRTLKYKRNKRPPLIEAVDKLIKKTIDALETGRIKATVSDLIRIVHLRQKLYPAAPVPGTVTWIDGW
jgi:hypothetical protein